MRVVFKSPMLIRIIS